MGNFFESMHSRKDPICPVEIGHRSISVAHLGVISVRMKQALKWNPDKEEFTGGMGRKPTSGSCANSASHRTTASSPDWLV